ncbi:MAG: hypothetical protein AMJ90_06835 [candidate division Zixibacteria bacterium SM23_73_2]|nr:MAG: hypothetical protein AMJ90_06835 [candidate division Zixibacteria bacterium SM23_73_2]
MKPGNAIVAAVFIWLAVYMPIKVFDISQTYSITNFNGINRELAVILAFVIPVILAGIPLIYGIEKNKKQETKAETPLYFKAIPIIENPKQETKKKTIDIDIDEKIDKICKKT